MSDFQQLLSFAVPFLFVVYIGIWFLDWIIYGPVGDKGFAPGPRGQIYDPRKDIYMGKYYREIGIEMRVTGSKQRQALCDLLDTYPDLEKYMEKQEREMSPDEVVRALDRLNGLVMSGKVVRREFEIEKEEIYSEITTH